MTRREAIATFLGASAALLPGCGDAPLPALGGEIVGASDAIGHKIRDGFRPQPAPGAWRDVGVVIVGGGIAGLAAARKLKQQGVSDFVLLELEDAAGGTSRSGRSPLIAYPWGAHYIPAPRKDNAPLVALLSEMGVIEGSDSHGEPVVGEQFLCRDPQERIFHKGKWYEGLYLRGGATADDLRQWAAFKKEVAYWTDWRDAKGRRAFTIPVALASDDPMVRALDTLSMADWLAQKNFTSPRLRWHIEYACRDDYGAMLEQTSAWAGLFYFASRVNRGGEDAQELIVWPEGNGRLVQHLRASVDANVSTGVAVTEIVPVESEKATRANVFAFNTHTSETLGYRAKHVIFAAPQFMARGLIRPFRDNPPEHLKSFEYGAWMVANLHLKNRPPEGNGFPLCWDNVLYDSPSLGYVAATHQTEMDRGATVFTYYYPLCDTDPKQGRMRLLSGDWRAWSDVALADLQRAHPGIRATTERLDVMRWGHAMIRPRPGFVWSGALEKARQSFKNIHFANTDLSGIALFEEAFHHGNRAADEVLEARALAQLSR